MHSFDLPEPAFVPLTDSRPDDRPWTEMSWPVRTGTELVGASIRLTPVDPDADAAELFAALDEERVWAHIPFRPTDVESLATFLHDRCADPNYLLWAVRTVRPIADQPAGAIVGMSSYLDVSVRDARLEIGFTTYRRSVWATTVNPEAKLLLLGHAFDELGAGRVQFKTDIRNIRSQRAIARLGATYEGTLRRYQRRRDGSVRDSALFSVTAEDWPAVRARLAERVGE